MSIIASTGILFSMNFVSAAWSFSDMLNTWANMDIFTYVLPFLLVFAMVFGILNKSKIFGEEAKGVNVIIALALGLLSLVGGYVPDFFQIMIPNLAVGLSVLLAVIILLGLFMKGDNEKYINWGLILVGILVFIFVMYDSFSGSYNSVGNLWSQYGSALVTLLVLIGIVALVVFWGKK